MTPTIPDPLPENNHSRYRFVIGTPYTYTLIAEAGVGELAGFSDVGSPVINSSGEVAFWAKNDATNGFTDDFALFSGDGITVTRHISMSDLPVVTDPLHHNYYPCLSMNDGGWITAVSLTWEVIPNNINPVRASAVYSLPPSGGPIVLD